MLEKVNWLKSFQKTVAEITVFAVARARQVINLQCIRYSLYD